MIESECRLVQKFEQLSENCSLAFPTSIPGLSELPSMTLRIILDLREPVFQSNLEKSQPCNLTRVAHAISPFPKRGSFLQSTRVYIDNLHRDFAAWVITILVMRLNLCGDGRDHGVLRSVMT